MSSISPLALAWALLLIAPVTGAAAQGAGQTVGVNAAIRNSVQMKTAADSALRPAIAREQVHIGDAIVSGAQSSLQVLLLDQSVFTVGANASITVDRFVYNPAQGTSDIAATVAKGAFRFMSGRLTPGAGQSAIKTPVASIGVRGTIVQGVVGPDIAQVLAGVPGSNGFAGNLDDAVLILLSGPGTGNQGFDKPGAIDVTVNGAVIPIEYPGQALLIRGAGQPPFGPFDLSDEAYAALVALLNGPGADQAIDNQGLPAITLGNILNTGGEAPEAPNIFERPFQGVFGGDGGRPNQPPVNNPPVNDPPVNNPPVTNPPVNQGPGNGPP